MRDNIVAEARACIGTRFHHQGRQKAVGLDCVGLLVVIAQCLELPVKDCLDYDRRPAFGLLEKQLVLSGLVPIDPVHLRHGDIALFGFDGPPQHVAVLAKALVGFSMVHAYMPARHVVEHRLDHVWQDRILGGFRFPGVE